MKAALLQLNVSDVPADNLDQTLAFVREAVAEGAQFVLTPEVTNCVSTSRAHQNEVLQQPSDDITLAALRKAAQDHGIWLLIGSLAVKTDDADGRFANRSYLIDPDGGITAQYDKIHMFDVQISETEQYRESAGYRAGDQAVVAQAPFGRIGMAVCYDMRFPLLANTLAHAGADILTYPSAFSPVTGAAHWHALLRARAIETGCYVLAPAQTGVHKSSGAKMRETYGRSLVVDPWGEVILDAGTDAGVYAFEMDMENVVSARRKIPALANEQPFKAP